jgi:type IV pilus assembly protein PilC
MLNYKYTARDPATGQKIQADVQADSEQAAAKIITQEGLVPVQITLSGEKGAHRFNRIKAKDRVLFSRQLSTLINAGLPLIQSLRSVNDQTVNKSLKIIIVKVINNVEAGSTLSASMANYPEVFNKVYISLIAAGETSGTLDLALERIAMQQEKDADIISKVRSALVYPAIVLVVMLVVVGFMLVKVMPQVQVLYAGLHGAKLPLVTQIMLAVSHALTHFWWILLIVVVVIGVFSSRWIRTLGGRRFIDKAKMHLGPLGKLFMKMYMARFARTGSTLVGSGVPLLQMLEITANAVNNVHIADSIHGAMEKVKGGKSLGTALENDPNFLDLVPNMLKIGEQSGSIEQMLAKTADYFEKEVDDEIKSIQTIIEPIMMVLLGVVAFVIVAAVLLPVYSLAGNSSLTSGF